MGINDFLNRLADDVAFERRNPEIKIDKPHDPWGPHVDLIQPLRPEIPGILKTRIGPTGEIINHEINIKGGFKSDV